MSFKNMISAFFLFAWLTTSAGFELKSRKANVNLKMVAIKDLPGSLPPVGFFDPFNLSEGKEEKVLKRWRESEIKHGRICMLAAIGILTAESFNPLFGGRILGASIYHFQEIQTFYPNFWLGLLFAIALVEGVSISKGWDARDKDGISYLKDDYIPGDLGFDPLNMLPESTYTKGFQNLPAAFKEKRTKELQNGRLAMLAVAGMVAQELVDGRTILAHFQEFGFGRSY